VASSSRAPQELYENPLIGRYASEAMCRLWSRQRIHSTWRKLWVALAEAERELGLPITQAQIDELAAAVDDIDFELAARYERDLRHDVMAHVYTYRDRCPGAGGILHLGATSAFVTDNTELILIRESLHLVRSGLVAVIDALARFAEKHRDVPCLGLTHLQPAQPTTVGKRATLWCYDLVLDLEEVEHRLGSSSFAAPRGPRARRLAF
jgi:adenylosuccinate lyase